MMPMLREGWAWMPFLLSLVLAGRVALPPTRAATPPQGHITLLAAGAWVDSANSGPLEPEIFSGLRTEDRVGRILVRDDLNAPVMDVAVEVTPSLNPVEVGQELFLLVTVLNRGTEMVEVLLTNQIADSMSFSAFPAEYEFSGHQVVSPALALSPSESRTIVLGVRPATAGEIHFTAALAPLEGDATPENNLVSVTTTVVPAGGAGRLPAMRLADWDYTAVKHNTGEILAETRWGLLASPMGVLEGAINLMMTNRSSPIYPARGPSGDGSLAFGFLDQSQWRPMNSDGLDIATVQADRVFVRVQGHGRVDLISASPSSPGMVIGTGEVALSADTPFELVVDRERSMAYLIYGDQVVAQGNPFSGQDAAHAEGLGNDFVVSIFGGSNHYEHLIINDRFLAATNIDLQALGFTDDQFRFRLTGPPGVSLSVEVSTDLVEWFPVRTLDPFTGDHWFVEDRLADTVFYRAEIISTDIPAAGTGNGALRVGQPLGKRQFVLKNFQDPHRTNHLDVIALLKGLLVFSAQGLLVEAVPDPSGNPRLIVDLKSVLLKPQYVTGDLIIEIRRGNEVLARYLPFISNVIHDEGVTPELPARGGTPVPSSGFGETRLPESTTGLSTPTTVPIPSTVERPGDDPRDEPPPVIYGEELGPPPIPPFISTCPAPALAEAGETTTSEASFVAGDPVYVHNGEFVRGEQDYFMDGLGPALSLVRTYRSRVRGQSIVGHNWSINWEKSLLKLSAPGGSGFLFQNGFGRNDAYHPNGQPLVPGLYSQVRTNAIGGHDLVQGNGHLLRFGAGGQLTRLADRSDQALVFAYNQRRQLVRVWDAMGRPLNLTYNPEGLLIKVEDWAGRQILYHYYQDGEPGGSPHDLKSVTATAVTLTNYPAGATTVYTYEYDAAQSTRRHNLVSITRPQAVLELGINPSQPLTTADLARLRARASVLNVYDDADRVIEQRYHTGTYTFEYRPGGTETIVTDRATATGQTNGAKTIFRYTGNVPRQIEQSNRLGRALFTMEHNDTGFVESTAYLMPSGRRLEFTYDRAHGDPKRRGDLVAMEWAGPNPSDRVRSTQALNAFGQVTKITDPRGYAPGANPDHFTTEFVYDARGNLIRTIFPAFTHFNPQGQAAGLSSQPRREAHYNRQGQITRFIDVNGVVKDYLYYPAGDSRRGWLHIIRQTAVDQSQVLETRFELDLLGRPIGVTEPSGAVSAARFNEFNRVTETTDPLGAKRQYQYDQEGRLTLVQLQNLQPDDQGRYRPGHPAWFTLRRAYDSFGRLQTMTRGSSDTNEPTMVTTFSHDAADRVATVTSPGGTIWRYEYGPRSLSTRTVVAAGTADEAAHRIEYDLEGKVSTLTDAEGHVAFHEYDWLGRLVALHDPKPAGAHTSAATRLEYDLASQITRVYRLDRQGAVLRDIRRVYDEHGRVAVEEDALAGTRAVKTYDAVGRNTRTSVYAVNGLTLLRETRRSFLTSRFGEVAWAEDGERNRIEYLYDSFLRLATVRRVGPTGQIAVQTSYGYDAKNRVIRLVESSDDGSLQKTNHIAFDSRNLVASAIDGNGQRVGHTYNALGQLLAVDRYLNPMVSLRETFAYDAEGRLAKLTDGEGHLSVYEYNRRGDRTQTTSFDGAVPHLVHQTRYDRRGLPIFVTDARGNRITNIFDELGRLVQRDIQRAAGVGGPTFERFKYDDMNQLLEASNDFSTLTQSYNVQGLVEEEIQSHYLGGPGTAGRVQRRFNLSGAPTQLHYPGGRILHFTNDLLGRPIQIAEGGQILAALSYLAPDLPYQRTLGNGTQMTFAYDGLARLQVVEHHQSGGLAQAAYAYTYDSFGNVLSETENVSQWRDIFTYDPLHRLDSAELSKNLATGAIGRLIDYEYDRAGNRTRVRDGAQITLYTANGLNQYTAAGPPGQARPYTWDPDGNLSESPGRKLFYDYARNLIRAEKGQTTYEFAYDALRRLIHKKITEPGQPAKETHYYYDHERIIETQGDESATYVHGYGLDEVVSYRRGATDFYLHQKRLWSVAHVTDSTGQIVESYRYEPFGARQVFDPNGHPRTETAVGNVIGFTGRWLEPELGLYYYRARWYDYELGRFITPDPKGFIDGLNVYEYARNNPATFFDPLGTSAEDFLSGLKDGFKDQFLGGWWDTLTTMADIVLNIGDYVETLKTMLRALTDPEIRSQVWGAIREAVETELADAWDKVEGAITALAGAIEYRAGQKLGQALGFLAARLMRGGGSIAAFFAKIGQRVKDILIKIRCVGLGTGCFLAGTLVLTEDGPRPIEEIQIGDRVLSRDQWSGKQDFKTVLRTFPGYNTVVCGIRVVDLIPVKQTGRTERRHGPRHRAEEASEDADEPPPGWQEIRSTPDHPFYVESRGFVRADSLQAGDRLQGDDGRSLQVASVVVWEQLVPTYNFEVEEWHTYFVSGQREAAGIWVHNNNDCPPVNSLPPAAPSLDKSWKQKIEGRAQKTGTPGHQFRTYREAIAEAKNPDVVSVHLDHGYNRGLDLEPKTIHPNRRPDVLSIYNDNTVKRIEVQSKTDVPAVLRSRNAALDQQLINHGFTPTPPVVVRPH